jgi:hypothetical protein
MAALCGLVLFTRVYSDFPSARWKIHTDRAGRQADRGALVFDVPYVQILANQTTPIVVIARLENPSPTDVTINVSWNDTNIGRATVGASSSTRVDLTLPAGQTLRGEERLRFRGGGDVPWKVTYLELANLYGSARGLVNAVFVPAQVTAAPVFPWPIVVLLTLGLMALVFVPGAAWSRKTWRIAHNAMIGAIVVLFMVALLSSVATRYKALLSWDTFWIFTAVLFAREIWRGFIAFRELASRHVLGTRAAFDSIMVAIVVGGFFAALMTSRLNSDYAGNYSGFLQLGKSFVDQSPLFAGRDDLKETLRLRDGGYDGQFMYAMAFDPFLTTFKDNPIRYNEVVDTPPYRYTRIGFSLLTKLFALNQPLWFPRTMIWLILASHVAGAVALGALVRYHGGHPAWALLYATVPGYLQSLNTGLPESIAGAGMLTGILLVILAERSSTAPPSVLAAPPASALAMPKSRYALASLVFACTLLVRETSVIVVVAMTLWLWLSKREWRGGFVVGLSVVVLVAWRAFITWRLFPAFGIDTFLYTPGNVVFPFKGMIDLWAVIGRGEYFMGFPALSVAGRVFPVILAMALVVSVALFVMRRDGLSGAAVVASLIAVSLDYPHVWSHVANAERVSFDAFILLLAIFATVVPGSNGVRAGDGSGVARTADTPAAGAAGLRWQRAMLLTFFAATAVYTVFYGFDAPLVRHVLFTPTAALF